MTESRAVPADVVAFGPIEPSIRVMFTAEQIAARVREMGLEVARDLGAATRHRCSSACSRARACSSATWRARRRSTSSSTSFRCRPTDRARPRAATVQLLTGRRERHGGPACGGVRRRRRFRDELCRSSWSSCKARGPASLRVATLLDKVPCRKVQVPVDYAGWKIGSEFVIGYGMDVAERYRNLPYVGVLEEEVGS